MLVGCDAQAEQEERRMRMDLMEKEERHVKEPRMVHVGAYLQAGPSLMRGVVPVENIRGRL